MPSVIETQVLPSGWRAVHLRNAEMEVTLLPDKGSEIYAVRSLRHDVDLLWKSPWGLRHPPVPSCSGAESQSVWLDYYAGGWQELFPNGGNACTVGGVPHTFHGEASIVPWRHEITHGHDGASELQLDVRLARTPFHIEKRVWLDPDRPVLNLWERVTNQGTTPQPFMWGHHPAFGAPFLDGTCRLDIPAATYLANEGQGERSTVTGGARSSWPRAPRPGGGETDLSRIPGLDAGIATMGYVLDLTEGWYALSNPGMGLGVALTWPTSVFPCLWLWQELGGSQGYPWHGAVYVMGVEPHSSWPGSGLATAIERGTARTLGPGESIEATLATILFDAGGTVTRVTPEGEVQFAS
jgi:hypothetical protein